MLEEAQSAQSLMLVVSRHADERLWAEVLNLGGFDVLALPFDRDELRWALSSALRHSPPCFGCGSGRLTAANVFWPAETLLSREEIAMFDTKTVLLPVDFSDRSMEAARQAKGIACRVPMPSYRSQCHHGKHRKRPAIRARRIVRARVAGVS